MRYAKNILILSVFVFLIISCAKEEMPVPAHNPGDVITATVNMESNYKMQIFYDLKSNTIVGQNVKTAWDLGFEATANGYRIILNTSKIMFARNTGNTNFTAVTDTTGFEANKKWDEASGNIDSTAIGDWRNLNNVYLIDRGYNETGKHQGFRKIQFKTVDETKYTVRFAQLNGSGDTTLQIEKDSIYNFQFLSFASKNIVIIEPPKANWDLEFTQFTHIFYVLTPPMPYLVTGCLLNRYNTKAEMDSLATFESINLSAAGKYTLYPWANTIGYNWKEYTGVTFITYTQMNYIIKDREGFYYKLHFVDFYNSSGVKGNPKWEYQKL